MTTRLSLSDRCIILVDLETTGLDVTLHEVIEIAAYKLSPDTLEIIDSWSTKIKPKNLETANPKALEVNGYNDEEWVNAMRPRKAWKTFSKFAKDGILMAYNVSFDSTFIHSAFQQYGIESTLDYHTLDIPSMVWAQYQPKQSLSMRAVSPLLGVEKEPDVHRAMAGVQNAYQIVLKLVKGVNNNNG